MKDIRYKIQNSINDQYISMYDSYSHQIYCMLYEHISRREVVSPIVEFTRREVLGK